MIGIPVGTLQPRITPDGVREWTFVLNKKKIEEDLLMRLIANEIGNRQFCPNGWEITKRDTVMGMLNIEGRCK